jgi:hypothetical protein
VVGYIKILIATIFVSWLISCAVIKAPSGGPIDKDAPKLLGQTVKDSSVRFKGGTISFDFDERLNTSGIKITTFPLMQESPQIKVDKRNVSIVIPDSLLEPNTTYKVSFGKSIKDIYEGNLVNGLDFTFSTGEYLDTLQLNGVVLQASTGLADTSSWVALYNNIETDSDIVNKKPMYVVKVDEAGAFSFSNLPQKDFYIYAIGDKNNNFKYDLPTESISFLNTAVVPISKPSKESRIILRSFKETTDTTRQKNKEVGFRFGIRTVNLNIDTTDTKKRTFDFTQPITIKFSQKINTVNKNKILISLNNEIDATAIINTDTVLNTIKINAELLQDTIYTLQLLDGWAADTGYFAPQTFKFRTFKKNDYGNITIQFAEIDSTADNYIILMQGEKTIAKQLITSKDASFKQLMPGSYSAKILIDGNKNGVWDNGSYFIKKQQPEVVQAYILPITIKANNTETVIWK